jgi:hypothetical protein
MSIFDFNRHFHDKGPASNKNFNSQRIRPNKMAQPTTSTAGSLSKIAVLESPSDYIKWEREITDYLAMNGYIDLRGRNKSPPTAVGADDTTLPARLELWYTRQERAVGIVMNRCGTNARAEIEALSPVDAEPVLRLEDCLQAIKQRFLPRGSAIFQQLDRNYSQLTLDQCKDVSDFAARLRKARNEIHELDEDCRIGKCFFVNKFLSGLTPAYSTFLTAFYQTHRLIPERDDTGIVTKEAVTFDEAVIAAEKEEQSQQLADKTTAGAFVAVRNGQRRCPHCARTGHGKEGCWNLNPELRVEFYKKRDEREKKRKRGEEEDAAPVGALAWQPPSEMGVVSFVTLAGATTTSPAITPNIDLLHGNWLLDTGCNQHICGEQAFLEQGSLRPYQGPPIQGFGGKSKGSLYIGTVRIPCCSSGGKPLWLSMRHIDASVIG